MDKQLYKLIQDYRNTPLLDKINHVKELPTKVEDWFLYENNLNRLYIKKQVALFKGIQGNN